MPTLKRRPVSLWPEDIGLLILFLFQGLPHPLFPKAICAEHPLWCTYFISEELSVIILKLFRLRTGREESGPYQCHAGPSEGLLSPNSSFLLPSPPHSILLSSTLSLPCFRGYNSSFLIKSQGNLQNHCNSFKGVSVTLEN